MINQETVTFKTVVAPIEGIGDRTAGDDKRVMEVCEITYPDGKVAAFPADSVSPEDGRKYSEIYSGKYTTFKRDPNADRVQTLEAEIAERKAEIDALQKQSAEDAKSKKEAGKIDQPVDLGKLPPSRRTRVPR